MTHQNSFGKDMSMSIKKKCLRNNSLTNKENFFYHKFKFNISLISKF